MDTNLRRQWGARLEEGGEQQERAGLPFPPLAGLWLSLQSCNIRGWSWPWIHGSWIWDSVRWIMHILQNNGPALPCPDHASRSPASLSVSAHPPVPVPEQQPATTLPPLLAF